MIEHVIERWQQVVAAPSLDALSDLLADDAVFYSPVLFTPQRGREVTAMYLAGAAQILLADGTFRYTKQVLGDDVAVLEFETTMGDMHVNGVDIIRCDDSGSIVEFRVMLRPLKAITAVAERKAALLASLDAQPQTP